MSNLFSAHFSGANQVKFSSTMERNFFIKIIAKSVQFWAKIGKKAGT